MKYLTLIFLSCCSVSVFACSCFNEGSFCNLIQSKVFAENGIVCIVESTGNVAGNYDFSTAEVKIVALLYGEVQPGTGSYLNTDSTIWILAGQGATCYESAFIFSNPGEQFVVASSYRQVYNFNNPPESGYSLFLCRHDVFSYQNTMVGPLVNDYSYYYYGGGFEPDVISSNQLPQLVNNCVTCVDNLNLPLPHDFPSVYRASSSIYSTANIYSNITYKANDRITLARGFKTTNPNNFKVVIDDCN